jgi:molecular chaperone GrpE
MEKQIEELKKQLEECQKQKADYLAGWQRERADFLNYKKEEVERMEMIIKFANEELILRMLPILDNVDVAEKNIPDNLKSDENVKGILQIKTQILDFLKSQGIEEIKVLGLKFNPNFQEAMEEVEVKDKDPGVVVEEVQKGYLMRGMVIRPAKVKINKSK